VLWLPDSGVLRASQAGFALPAAAHSGQAIAASERVVALVDPGLDSRVAIAAAREAAARARWDAARVGDPARAEQLRSPWEREAAELANLRDHAARLDLRSPAPGRLWLNGQDDLPGQYLKQGQIVGYVVPDAPPVVRVIVDQNDADLIRFHTGSIGVQLPAEPGRIWPATVRRTVPAASHDLPSAALGRQGGGAAAIDPRDDSGRRALQTHFEIELGLPLDFPYRLIGGRVSVRFEHPAEPLAWRIGRGLRRLFLAYVHN
jgi:putative peptide zinc metalloprotease protein